MEITQQPTREEQEAETSEPTEELQAKKKLELFFEDIMGNDSTGSNQTIEEIATTEIDILQNRQKS